MAKSTMLRKLNFLFLATLVIITGYLTYSEVTGSDVCILNTETGQSNCSNVQNSAYGKIFGIKVIQFGFFAFVILLVLYFITHTEEKKHQEKFHIIYMTATTLGALFSIYFLYIQFFILQTICPNCLVIDNLMLVLFVSSLTEFMKERRRWSIG
jgi:uncharacterized membrane protein